MATLRLLPFRPASMLPSLLLLLCSITSYTIALQQPSPIIPNVFPVSTRQALLKKSQQIVDTVGYTTAGFSNRKGLVLTPIYVDDRSDDNANAPSYSAVYAADRPFLWNTIDVMGRMVVIELPPTTQSSSSSSSLPDLWVHSPVALDGPLQAAINSIGNVKHIVSPNYEHVKYAAQWKQAYPNAELWGCPGLAEKMPAVEWSGELPSGYRPEGFAGGASKASSLPANFWDTSLIESLHVDIEVNPFTGQPFFNECIFHHKPSGSFISTDFFWNYPASPVVNAQFNRDDSWELAPAVDNVPWASRLWKFGMDQVYLKFFDAFMVTDKTRYHAILSHVINEWQCEIAVPAHGDVLRGRALVRQALVEFFGYNK